MKHTIIVILLCFSIGHMSYAEERFEVTHKQDGFANIRILRDNLTGQEYLFYKLGYGAGLTKLEGKDEEKIDTFMHSGPANEWHGINNPR